MNMQIKPSLGMLVLIKDEDGSNQVAVIQDIHTSGTRFWMILESNPYGTMIEVMIRNNGLWRTKKERILVELTLQNEFHSYSLNKRVA